jgi:hypothetical protein
MDSVTYSYLPLLSLSLSLSLSLFLCLQLSELCNELFPTGYRVLRTVLL